MVDLDGYNWTRFKEGFFYYLKKLDERIEKQNQILEEILIILQSESRSV